MLESLLSLARSYTRYYDSSSAGWIVVILVVALIALLIFLRFVPLGLWITSLAAGVHVSIASLVGMRLRRIQPKRLVEPLIKARKAGLNVTLPQLETHYLAGGNVDRVINALIAAQGAEGFQHGFGCMGVQPTEALSGGIADGGGAGGFVQHGQTVSLHGLLLGGNDRLPGIGEGTVEIKNSQFDVHGGSLLLCVGFWYAHLSIPKGTKQAAATAVPRLAVGRHSPPVRLCYFRYSSSSFLAASTSRRSMTSQALCT